MTDPQPILPKLDAEQLVEFQKKWNQHPGMRHMGAELDLSTRGLVRAVVDPIQPEQRGGATPFQPDQVFA